MSESVTILRFDEFELDTAAGELRRQGERLKLPPQPFKVLELLVRNSGEVLTRTDIRDRIWSDSFVDFEQGLNFCIRQIREALGEAADAPRFIETLPRRGYRFLLPVEAPAAAPPKKTIKRLIVLPFRMLRPDPDRDFLAFSLPEALTTSLSGPEIAGRPLQSRRLTLLGRHAGLEDDRFRNRCRSDCHRHVVVRR
jgi:DNA-binding winged helix-turn-helix (wHTH) protein